MRVSVCLLTYNHERFLAQTLEGILGQSIEFDLEIVVGEDHSTDRTMEVLRDYVSRYPSVIRVLPTNENLGPMRNFLRTFKECRGDYIALVEGDDYWTDMRKLQAQVQFLEAHRDYAICAHRVHRVKENGEVIDVYPRTTRTDLTIHDLLRWNFLFTCSVVLRGRLAEPFPDWMVECAVGDWPMFLLHAQQGAIHVFPQVLAAYRQHGGGMWSQQIPRRSCEKLISTLQILRRHLQPRNERKVCDAIAWHKILLGFHAAFEGNLSALGSSLHELIFDCSLEDLVGVFRIGTSRVAEEIRWSLNETKLTRKTQTRSTT